MRDVNGTFLQHRQGNAVTGPGINLQNLFPSSFSTRRINRAKYVLFFRSLMITRSTVTPSPVKMWPIRSCVSGRSLGVLRRNIVIAAPTL